MGGGGGGGAPALASTSSPTGVGSRTVRFFFLFLFIALVYFAQEYIYHETETSFFPFFLVFHSVCSTYVILLVVPRSAERRVQCDVCHMILTQI